MPKYCKLCGKLLLAKQKDNIYCSVSCATTAKETDFFNEWLEHGRFLHQPLTYAIRKRLIEQAGYKCELCGWGEINPSTKKTPLEIHHIDGDYKNNKPDNIQVLCPNCHSLTPNYKALNKTDRHRLPGRKDEKNHRCIDCGKVISYGATRCVLCQAKHNITIKPVSREKLKNLIRTTSFRQIAKKYHVSDKSICKWCVRYGLPSRRKDIVAIDDQQWVFV